MLYLLQINQLLYALPPLVRSRQAVDLGQTRKAFVAEIKSYKVIRFRV